MLLNRFTLLPKLIQNINVLTPAVVNSQVNFFSAKPPNQPVTIEVDGEKKRLKRQAIPRITLISPDESISIVTMEEAQLLSKRRDLKLVKIIDVDAKSQRPVYKLMTGVQYHAEELKQRAERKKNKNSDFLKGEKLLMVNSSISNHDLEVNINKILKWIAKRYEVRVIVNGGSKSPESLESIYKFFDDKLKDHTRLLQKRMKGNDLKFQIIPRKDDQQNEKKPS